MRALLPLLLALSFAAPAAAQTDLRAWHADGQTWLVWRDDQTFTGSESWSVYRSSSAITDLANAQLVGRTYPQDAIGVRLYNAASGATWTVPDASGTGTYTLAADEALFVYTPRAVLDEHFAVVKTGDTALSPDNTYGPVTQTLDPVVPHVQVVGADGPHAFQLHAVWIDGDLDESAGRADFPVFGPASLRGQARLFCVFEPATDLPSALVPAVVFLHGGGGNYWNYRPTTSAGHLIDLEVEDGLYVTFDDRTYVRTPSSAPDGIVTMNSRWLGSCRGYDRFEPMDLLPAPDEVVVDYSPRWLEWAFAWLIAERDVDPDRLALMGLSMGAGGVNLYTRSRPEQISAATAFVMPTAQNLDPLGAALWGTAAQNLATTLAAGKPILDVLHPTTRLSDEDLPFLRFVDGTNDPLVPWSGKPPVYDEIDADRWGTALYWDEREHTANNGGWSGAHFVGSPRHGAQWLTGYRRDRSFPAFHGVDHALGTPGQQPHPGDAVLPANGDPWGTWGGWFDWQRDTIVDRPERWSASLGLVTGASFGPDNAPNPFARASVTIRRPQQFQPAPGTRLSWTLRRVSDGVVIAGGQTSADAEGVVTVPDLVFGPQPLRLEVWAPLARGGLNPL